MKKMILLLASMALAMVLVSGVALAAPKKGTSGGDTGTTTDGSTITVIYGGELITATVHEGTSGDDTIIGTPENDAIKGYDGNDHLYGDPSQDVGGKDYIAGGNGDDTIDGGPNADLLSGGSGNDQINAADGTKDWVYCGDGVDTVEADSVDELYNCE